MIIIHKNTVDYISWYIKIELYNIFIFIKCIFQKPYSLKYKAKKTSRYIKQSTCFFINLAGAEGFEPSRAVLETDVLPLTLYPQIIMRSTIADLWLFRVAHLK